MTPPTDSEPGMTPPLISVIMPVHNSRATIEDSVRSVLNQTFRDLELIVVENGSTDDTVSILGRLAGLDPRITAITDGPLGTAAARNEGVRLARGTWLTFLDHDDEYAPEFLETIVHAIRSHPELDGFAVNGSTMGRPFSTITPGRRFRREQTLDLDTIVGMQIVTGQLALRREILVEIGGFDPTVNSVEDKHVCIRYFAEHRGLWIPRKLFRYRYDRWSQCHIPARRTKVLRSLLGNLALARTYDPPASTIATIERLEQSYRVQLEAFPRRAGMEEALANGEFRGARAAYLGSRKAYGRLINWIVGLPVMMLSPRLFAHFFIR